MISDWIPVAVTVLATLVALFLGLKEEIKRKIWKPNLELKISSAEPHCIPIATPSSARKDFSIAGEVVLRAEIYNTGKRASKNTWIRFIRYYYLEIGDLNRENPDYLSQDITWKLAVEEPVDLKWVGIGFKREVTIPAKSYLLTEIAELKMNEGSLTLCTRSPLLDDHNRQRAVAFHCIEVMFGSDQFESVTKYIFFTVRRNPYVSSAVVCDKSPNHNEGRIFQLIENLEKQKESEHSDYHNNS